MASKNPNARCGLLPLVCAAVGVLDVPPKFRLLPLLLFVHQNLIARPYC